MQSQPIDFHPPATQADPILLPVTSTLFADRAERFASLAGQHSLGDWLNFLADLSRAQHEVLQGLPSLQLPDARTLEQARTHAMPPLNASSLPRPAAWRLALQQLVQRLQATAPESGQAALTALLAASESELEALADMLLKGDGEEAEHITYGSTLSLDGNPSRQFDFMLSNPPYGKSWKTDADKLGGKDEILDLRFNAYTDDGEELKMIPRSSDGQLLFLLNNVAKMKTDTELGSRIIEEIEQSGRDEAPARVTAFIRGVREAMDAACARQGGAQ